MRMDVVQFAVWDKYTPWVDYWVDVNTWRFWVATEKIWDDISEAISKLSVRS